MLYTTYYIVCRYVIMFHLCCLLLFTSIHIPTLRNISIYSSKWHALLPSLWIYSTHSPHFLHSFVLLLAEAISSSSLAGLSLNLTAAKALDFGKSVYLVDDVSFIKISSPHYLYVSAAHTCNRATWTIQPSGLMDCWVSRRSHSRLPWLNSQHTRTGKDKLSCVVYANSLCGMLFCVVVPRMDVFPNESLEGSLETRVFAECFTFSIW